MRSGHQRQRSLDSDFENLMKTSRRLLKRDGILKRRGREGLRRGRRANSASLASASSAGTSAPFAIKLHGPRNFKSLWLGFRAAVPFWIKADQLRNPIPEGVAVCKSTPGG